MGVRTGQQYIDGLRDERQVWLAGERVADITTHPVLAGQVQAIAELYDMQHDPKWVETLTYLDGESGERIPLSLSAPHTQADLLLRRKGYQASARATFGLMGRSPDYLNIVVTAFAEAADYFGQVRMKFAENIRWYHQYCRERDLFLAHATINPQSDRSRASSEQEDEGLHLRIVKETRSGLIVRGAKMIGTLVPTADELVVFPLPGYRPGDETYTVAFAIPIATAGLRIICREPFGLGRNDYLFDHPLARYDEMDATVVFDDVAIPWQRVFFYGDVDIANRLFDATTARHQTGYQDVIRAAVKAELLVGVAVELAKSARTDTFVHVQEMLGESIGLLELTRGATLLAEDGAKLSQWDTMTPDIAPIQALRYHFPRFCARLIEIIQILGGGSLLSTPTLADIVSPDLAGIVRFFRSAGTPSGHDRIHLLKLAWEITGDAFGQRQLQYERYHAGDPVRLAAGQYLSYDLGLVRESVSRVLGS